MAKYNQIIKDELGFEFQAKMLPTKGVLAWEYNPFRNYRITECNKFKYNDKFFTLTELEDNLNITIGGDDIYTTDTDGNILSSNFGVTRKRINTSNTVNTSWYHCEITENDEVSLLTEITSEDSLYTEVETIELYEKGQLVDFETNELNFSLKNPVDIVAQESYDHSVNLILNDGKNIPRLVNSRFSPTEKNQYQIIDRKGDNDTNIYDLGDLFDIDTSLYKRTIKIPKLEFKGVLQGGNLEVGNYHFYFKYADADGNETDWVAESGLVSIFIGTSPLSIDSGFSKQNSKKLIKFKLSNIDSSYNYVKVYYSKETSGINQESETTYHEIIHKYIVDKNNTCNITISGTVKDIDSSADVINAQYSLVSSAETQAVCKNMLFLGNVEKPNIDYKELTDLSLRFGVKRNLVDYNLDIDSLYNINGNSMGYYDPNYIYNYTGYWNDELYRLGIVYILPDNSLSPVFNIRGGYNLTEDSKYSKIPFTKNGERNYITISEDDYSIISESSSSKGSVQLENAKGVITLKTATSGNQSNYKIYGLKIELIADTNKEKQQIINKLKSCTKGFFFVRQKRMPTTLCLTISIATDKHNYLPVLPIGLKTNLFTSQLTGVAYTQQDFSKIKGTPWWKKVINAVSTVTSAAAGLAAGGIVGAVVTGLSTNKITGVALNTISSDKSSDNTDYYGKATVSITNEVTGETTKRYASETDLSLAKNGLKSGMDYYMQESFIDSENRYLTNDFLSRIRPIEKNKVKINAGLCPEFEMDSTFYGNLFTGDEFVLKKSDMLFSDTYLHWNLDAPRNFYTENFKQLEEDYYKKEYKSKILAIPDSSKTMAIDKNFYKGVSGNAVDGWRFDYIAKDNKKTKATNFVRGAYGPYIGITGITGDDVLTTYDIKIPGYSNTKMSEYFSVRYNDNSPFYCISDRISIDDFNNKYVSSENTTDYILYRGDCFICQYTHRMNRNFMDPSTPTNDDIVDYKCWADNYTVKDSVIDKSKFSKINIGDLNAIRLGMWVTFTVRSTKNLNIRAVDNSHSDEISLIGHGRGFYPRFQQNLDGSYKTPESFIFNKGFLKDLGSKLYIEAPDVPAIKNEFSSRIMYSNPASNDSFVNNFRVFESSHMKDYSKEFGAITKLVESDGSLLVVFEHGIGVIPVNEKALIQNAQGDDVYIGVNKVIDEPRIISDKFGSLWKESIIKTPHYIYGVDTVAKKIWRVGIDSSNVETISDFHIQQFLNQNITLGERELTPIIGIRNVKSHYNAYKNDVMFTFYDDLRGFEEKVWNICWNELTQVWTTLYSWVPSYSENIFNQFFTFDRNTSKWIGKLGLSNSNSDFADGITLDCNIIDDSSEEYLNVSDSNWYRVGLLNISNRDLPTDCNITYTLEHDNFGNYKYFEIGDGTDTILDEDGNVLYNEVTNNEVVTESNNISNGKSWGIYQIKKLPDDYPYPVILLNISADAKSITDDNKSLLNSTLVTENYYNNTIAICLNSVYENGNFNEYDETKPSLMSAFWKHGQAGLQDIAEKIKPCYWYGKQHPFEVEFCVSEYPEVQKIFDNLQIISNSAEPESFHYWIQGDSLSFANDKKNMYVRQEATKELYQYNGSDILYNDNWKEIESEGLTQNSCSTLLPQIYEARQDTTNDIYDYYKKISALDKNYDELSGTEVTHDEVTDEYGLWVHSDGINIDEGEGNRLRGNMQYKGDTWRVQIAPINFVLKNEYNSCDGDGNLSDSTWTNGKIPITIANIPIPSSVNASEIEIPEDLQGRAIDTSSWGALPLIQNVKYYDKAGHEVGKENADPNETGHDVTTKYTYTYGNLDDASTRLQAKIRDKYIKIRIRYSGEKLAIIRKIITVYSTVAS